MGFRQTRDRVENIVLENHRVWTKTAKYKDRKTRGMDGSKNKSKMSFRQTRNSEENIILENLHAGRKKDSKLRISRQRGMKGS